MSARGHVKHLRDKEKVRVNRADIPWLLRCNISPHHKNRNKGMRGEGVWGIV
jgi:hypothetical protein